MKIISYEKYFSSVVPELKQVDRLLLKELYTEFSQLYMASTHLISGGGKRLRPAFLLLTGKLFRKDISFMLPMAVAMEMVHMGTLVHDDVVDASDLRRGIETVRVRYGERISVCAGNFLFARGLQLASSYGNRDILQRLIQGGWQICAGEIQQLNEAFSFQQNVRGYLKRIRKKTALLISLSCEIGAIQCQASSKQTDAMRGYGHNLGMAFQISDDILDFIASETVFGKQIGSDLRNGLLTYPVLYALKGSPEGRKIGQILQGRGEKRLREEEISRIIDLVKQSGGIQAAIQLAEKYTLRAVKCLEIFPDSLIKKDLCQIASEVAHRDF